MSDTTTITTPTPPATTDRKRLLLYVGGTALVCLVVGTVLGGAMGGEPAQAKPLPAKTVTVEVAAEADETCKEVALELYDQLGVMASDVVTPVLEAGQTLSSEFVAMIDYGIAGTDVDKVVSATEDVNGASDTLDGLTERITAIAPDFQTCVG